MLELSYALSIFSSLFIVSFIFIMRLLFLKSLILYIDGLFLLDIFEL